MVAMNSLPICIALELQIFNDSIGIRLKNAVHLGKKSFAAIFIAIVYWIYVAPQKPLTWRTCFLGSPEQM